MSFTSQKSKLNLKAAVDKSRAPENMTDEERVTELEISVLKK